MEALQDTPATQTIHASRAEQIAQAVVVGVLIAIPALVCLHMAFVADADIWWHMRVGQWILAHHQVPHVDYFSRGAGRPWAAYSWLFEVAVFQSFQHLGLAGILAYTTAMVVAIAAAIYHLVRRLQPDFMLAVLLTFVASLALVRLFAPRAWLITILFFAIEIDILMGVRKTGRNRQLLWLPALYILWANLHIQFIDGLVVMGIAVGEAVLSRWWGPARTRLKPAWMIGIFVACLLATCISPFGWRIYQVAYHAATQPGILYLITEFHALAFRTLADYTTLFLALAAAGTLAWRRRFAVFETLLLAFAAIVSFRSGRDMWVMIIVATTILAQGLRSREKEQPSFPVYFLPITAGVVALLLFAGTVGMHVNNAELRAQVAEHLPLRAVEVAKEKGFSGPLFNNFDWGGYLIWKLRMPVSVDGRADYYGDKRLQRSFSTWDGAPDWASDPDLNSARLVVAPINAPLTQLLRMDPHFQLAFQDKIAALFVAR